MDSVLRAFSIGFLLRCLFAGVSFLLSFKVAGDGVTSIGATDLSNLFAVILPLALFCGVTLYSLHRSLVYPWIEQILNAEQAENVRKKCPLVSDKTIALLNKQWRSGADVGKEPQALFQHYATWADHTHLQYCFALSIATGSLSRTLTDPGDYVFNTHLGLLLATFLISAVVSDWRLHAIRESIARSE
jgi:hypothetical protein